MSLLRGRLRGSVTIGIPTIVVVVLSLLAGLLAVLNEVVFGFSTQWHAYFAIILIFLAGLGISPLLGPAFRAALHLPTWASALISAAMSAALLALSTAGMPHLAHAIIAAVLTVLSGLGFAPSAPIVPPVAKAARR